MSTLTFLGAVGEVTGSRYLIDIDDDAPVKLLLECGLRQGGPDAERRNAEPMADLARSLSVVVISHGHLDHAGLLPRLVREGYRGPIHCTGETLELLDIMLRDAAAVMGRDLEWENRRRIKAGRQPLQALYEQTDVDRALEQCVPHGYGEVVTLPGDARLVFRDAGHILGSAIVELNVPSGGRRRQIVFSGDLGNPGSPLMRDPERVSGADVVLMESTYGNRDHRPQEESIEEFAQVLEAAHDEGGNVLIPAFAVGRTQEILFHLSRLYHAGRLRQQRVFLDSPMAIRVTELYARNWRALDQKDVSSLNESAGGEPHRFLPGFRATRTVEESMEINRIHGGAVIIAGSGMCTGGRILHHLRYNLGRSSTHIVIAGFQAAGTLGRALVDGATEVRVLGETLPVRAQIHTIGGFSAHAGQRDLLSWAGAFRDEPRLYLVHGETVAREALREALLAHGLHAVIPELEEVVAL